MNALVVLAGLAAIVAVVVLVAVIVLCVVRKARAEDLPQLMTGLSQVVEAPSVLPWARQEGVGHVCIPRAASGVGRDPPAPEPRTVPGTVVTVNSSSAARDGHAIQAPQTHPLASDSYGGVQ